MLITSNVLPWDAREAICVCFESVIAQDQTDKWDNQLFIGNKVAGGKDQWKFSGELQTRLKNDLRDLDRWFLEGTANYLINKKWEIVAPLTRKIHAKA